jgi:hypothetical protein
VSKFEALSGLLALDVDADSLRLVGQVRRLHRLRRDDLAPEKQQLVGKAKSFYASFDFLDAYRFALAASS